MLFLLKYLGCLVSVLHEGLGWAIYKFAEKCRYPRLVELNVGLLLGQYLSAGGVFGTGGQSFICVGLRKTSAGYLVLAYERA